MAEATTKFSSYDRSDPSDDHPTLATQNRRVHTANSNPVPPRPGQHLDDADLLAWKRQYANINSREQNMMSNSAEDLSQLIDRIPYQFEVFAQDYNDMDDDEIHFDNGNNYDYETVIQERLKKANEEFEHDQTSAELKHRQRVSFDAVVKAVDIVQQPQEHDTTDLLVKPPISTVTEETPTSATSSQNGNNPHEYTVPLNDTQIKEGPTLLQQLKAMQFHGIPMSDRWSSTNPTTTNDSSTREDSSSKSDNTDTDNSSDMTTKSSSPQKSMVVSINGGFELQNEDDYTARNQSKFDDNDDELHHQKSSTTNSKVTFIPTPPTEAKQQQDPTKPQAPRRPHPSMTRPKSSDVSQRPGNSNSATTKSLSDNRNKKETHNPQRPKSAGLSQSWTPYIMKPPSTVDFDELLRKAAEKKRAELREERIKKEKADAKRKEELAKAKESFEKWVRDKDAERKKLNEEKRMEREDQETRELECGKELGELREKKYKEWIERKNREVVVANEFKKLQAEDEEMTSGGSSSSINNGPRRGNHQAFQRWLRRKYEQSREEKRQLRLEARHIRRRQRRSIKRFQLQQDLQLAKSFGYS